MELGAKAVPETGRTDKVS